MHEKTRRPLSAQDRRFLTRQLARSKRRVARARRGAWGFALPAVLVPCALHLALSLARLTAIPPAFTLIGWPPMVFLLLSWDLVTTRRKEGALQERLQRALDAGWCEETRVVASAVVKLEDVEDFGDAFAFQVGPDEVLFLKGQHLPATRRFPTTDFSLLAFFAAEHEEVGLRWVPRGRRLVPQRVLSADEQEGLAAPADGDVLTGRLETLEAHLRAPPAPGAAPSV
jgi:hypothetical protein